MTAGRVALVLMVGLAAAWWGTLAWDASQGRASWLLTVFSMAALLAWATTMSRWGRALRPQPALRVYWLPRGLLERDEAHRLPTRWHDDQGYPIDVRVAMDLGAGLVLRLQPSNLARGQKAGLPQWRWVGAQALHGPWRWRLMTSARHSPLPADEKPIQPLVASLALPGSQKATLPKSARRSA